MDNWAALFERAADVEVDAARIQEAIREREGSDG